MIAIGGVAFHESDIVSMWWAKSGFLVVEFWNNDVLFIKNKDLAKTFWDTHVEFTYERQDGDIEWRKNGAVRVQRDTDI